jgi:hypothetical protein
MSAVEVGSSAALHAAAADEKKKEKKLSVRARRDLLIGARLLSWYKSTCLLVQRYKY